MLRQLIRLFLPLVPKAIVGRVAKRYVAGASLEEGLDRIEQLNSVGLAATLALLGEEITERERASKAVEEYLRACREIGERGLDSGISIKLTLLGLKVDEGLCRENVEHVVGAAAEHDVLVRIDMEDHTCTDVTLKLFKEVLSKHANVGLVLQSYLRRTLADIARLQPGTSVRLCKGIYIEPRSVAFKDHETVRLNFVAALERLFDVGARVGIATHDEYLVSAALGILAHRGLAADRYEFQTLLGVDEELRDILRDGGHRVRVYVPYGDDWYDYSIRRLRENPQIAIYVLRAFFSQAP